MSANVGSRGKRGLLTMFRDIGGRAAPLMKQSRLAGSPMGRTEAAARRGLGHEYRLQARRSGVRLEMNSLVHLAHVARGDLEVAAEAPREMRNVLEADLIGDFRDGAVTFRVRDQNFIGALEALDLNELPHRRLVVVEETVKITQRYATARGYLLGRKRLVAQVLFDEVDDPAAQMIARIADVSGCATVLRGNRQRDEADDLRCQGLRVRRRLVDKQLRNVPDHPSQQVCHLVVRFEAPADMIVNGDQTSAKFRGGDAHQQQPRALVR